MISVSASPKYGRDRNWSEFQRGSQKILSVWVMDILPQTILSNTITRNKLILLFTAIFPLIFSAVTFKSFKSYMETSVSWHDIADVYLFVFTEGCRKKLFQFPTFQKFAHLLFYSVWRLLFLIFKGFTTSRPTNINLLATSNKNNIPYYNFSLLFLVEKLFTSGGEHY